MAGSDFVSDEIGVGDDVEFARLDNNIDCLFFSICAAAAFTDAWVMLRCHGLGGHNGDSGPI